MLLLTALTCSLRFSFESRLDAKRVCVIISICLSVRTLFSNWPMTGRIWFQYITGVLDETPKLACREKATMEM